MKKKDIKVGQTVYVTVEDMFLASRDSKGLLEYEVTKVNTSSIYAAEKGTDFVIRFEKRTLRSKSPMDSLYTIHLDKEKYLKTQANLEEKKRLIGEIKEKIVKLDLEKLREIEEILNS